MNRWVYLAGIIDGEGSVALYRKRNQKGYLIWEPKLEISNTSKKFHIWVKDNFGGGTSKHRFNPEKYPRTKTSYTNAFSSNKIREIAPKVLPFLIIKKRQTELLLEAVALIGRKRKTAKKSMEYRRLSKAIEIIYLRLRKLNKRGK